MHDLDLEFDRWRLGGRHGERQREPHLDVDTALNAAHDYQRGVGGQHLEAPTCVVTTEHHGLRDGRHLARERDVDVARVAQHRGILRGEHVAACVGMGVASRCWRSFGVTGAAR